MQIIVSKDKLKSTINHAIEIKTQISNSVHTTEKHENRLTLYTHQVVWS